MMVPPLRVLPDDEPLMMKFGESVRMGEMVLVDVKEVVVVEEVVVTPASSVTADEVVRMSTTDADTVAVASVVVGTSGTEIDAETVAVGDGKDDVPGVMELHRRPARPTWASASAATMDWTRIMRVRGGQWASDLYKRV
jgi:hypothetical protein